MINFLNYFENYNIFSFPLSGIWGLKKNFALLELLERLEQLKEIKTVAEFIDDTFLKCDEDDLHQADVFCTVCLTNLCNYCAKETHKSKTLLLHKKIPISEKPRINPPCSLHHAHILEFACLEESCRENPLMCYICKDYGIHKGHKHVLIEAEAENIRKSIQNALQHVKAFSGEVTVFARKLAEISEKIEGTVFSSNFSFMFDVLNLHNVVGISSSSNVTSNYLHIMLVNYFLLSFFKLYLNTI